MKNVRLTALYLLTFTLTAAAAYADGFRNPPEGAAQLGRSAARTTLTDDATTAVHNPANMVELDQPQALGALTLIHSETEFKGAMGRSGKTEDPWKVIPSLFYVTPLKEGSMAVGVSVTSPYGQSTEWEKDGPFMGTAPYFAELTVLDVSPSFAARLSDSLQVGVGLDIIWSELTFDQLYPWSPEALMAGGPFGDAGFEGDGYGAGAHLGLTWDVNEMHRVAFTYRSPISIDYEGDFEISDIPPPLAGLVSPNSDFETEITFPTVLAFGYGAQLSEALRIGAEVEWIEFSKYDQLDIDIGRNQMLLTAAGLESIPQEWDDTFTFGVGGDYALNEQTTLRAGYMYFETPIPEETLSPTLPDADRHLFSIGLGYTRGPHTLDLAYAFSVFDDLEITSSANPFYNGEYEIDAHLMAVSYAFDF